MEIGRCGFFISWPLLLPGDCIQLSDQIARSNCWCLNCDDLSVFTHQECDIVAQQFSRISLASKSTIGKLFVGLFVCFLLFFLPHLFAARGWCLQFSIGIFILRRPEVWNRMCPVITCRNTVTSHCRPHWDAHRKVKDFKQEESAHRPVPVQQLLLH